MVFRAPADPARDALVLELDALGNSMGDIARQVGVTRSTVSGILHRNSGKRTPASTKRAPADVTAWNRPGASVPPSPTKKVKAKDPALDIEGKPFTFETARPGLYQCRWVAGEPTAEAIICGHKTKPGEPYCAFHRDIAYQAARPAPPKHIPDRAIGQ
jgi:GcrA cell cycle regulator